MLIRLGGLDGGKGPVFCYYRQCFFFFFWERNEERGGRLLGQRDGEFVI